MALQAGIVGLPNVGKSTLFNALTSAGAESANYPFCTIEPNVGVVAVPDPRLDQIASKITTDKIIPTSVEIVDIAGLVRGASQNEGLGNQFLGNIRAVDAILHVVRCFDDDDITHVDGDVSPTRDIETINLELIFADLEVAERRFDKWRKAAKSGDKEAVAERDFAERLVALLTEGKPVRSGDWVEADQALLQRCQMITAKPVLYVCNVDEDGLSADNAHVTTVRAHAASEGSGVVVLCAKVEAEISELDADDRVEFLSDLGLKEPGLSVLARGTYELLGLQTFFTAGEKEIRAWTIHQGWTAPKAAGVIHTDFERGFIRAEVYTIPDLMEYSSEAGMKAAGKLRLEGKEYVVQDGDVMHFRFNV
ncbi:MAG: redox-regulated ATPase YchF [Myxococcales bacterium]|nr:redox-regulated ATPase YchF [Myxococcales bacterium]